VRLAGGGKGWDELRPSSPVHVTRKVGVSSCAERDDQFRPEAQQPILVGQHQPADALVQKHLEELVQSFFAIIQAGTTLSDDLVAPAFGGAESLQQFLQTLRRWEEFGELVPDRRSAGGTRYYDVAKILGLGNEDAPTIGYAGVASHDQKNDLVRERASARPLSRRAGGVG
jgi:MerR HTH family regulatory protein